MCEDVPRCENIKKDVRKLSDIWFPEHFKVYNKENEAGALIEQKSGVLTNSTLKKAFDFKGFLRFARRANLRW